MRAHRPRSTSSAGRGLLAAALGIVASANFVHAVGGDDVRIFRSTGEVHHAAAMAFTATGEVFAAHWSLANPQGYQIYRSTDRGTTWNPWGEIDYTFGLDSGPFDMVVVEGTPTLLAFAFVDHEQVVVRTADIADPEADWQHITADDAASSILSIQVASQPRTTVPGHVYVGYCTETETRFVRSTDGGATFGLPIVLGSFASGDDVAVSLACDAGDSMRFVWIDRDPTTEDAVLNSRRAVNGGAAIGDWSPTVVIDEFECENTDVSVSVAPDPDSNDLLVSTDHELNYDSTTRLYYSSDGGIHWTHTSDLEELHGARLFWGSGGPGFAAMNDRSSNGYYLGQPESTPDGPWTAEVMLDLNPGSTYLAVDGAVDPSTGEFAMVGMSNEVEEAELWFDGEWRDAPGYGISEPGAPFDVERIINSAPAIQDVNGDRDHDVVFTTAGDSIGYYDPGADEIEWVADVGPTGENSAPVVVDVDEDGLREIFVGTTNGRIYGLRADGTTIPGWPVNLGTGDPVYLSAGVITNLATTDIVAVSSNKVWILWPSGYRALNGQPLPAGHGAVVGRAAIGDVSGDGDTEIVVTAEHAVVLMNDGGIEATVLVTPAALTHSAPASLGDLDDDGDLEITAPRTNGRLGLIHHDGATYGAGWPFDTGTGSPLGPVVIANSLGGGNAPQLHFCTEGGDVFVVDLAGTVATGWPKNIPMGSEPYDPVVQRISPGTTDQDIVLGTSNSYARAWDAVTAEEILGWKRDVWEPVRVSAVADDLDQDGMVELVIPAGSLLWVLDMGVEPANDRRSWTQSGYDPQRQSCWDCPPQIATAVEEPENGMSAPASATLAVRPNPARGVMHLDLIAPGVVSREAELRIHDVHGRLVKVLDPTMARAGAFAATWDGTNAAGRPVASGVYWARAVVRGGAADVQLSQRLIRVD